MQFKHAVAAPAPAVPEHPFGAPLGVLLGLWLRAAARLTGPRGAAARPAQAAAAGHEDDALRRQVLARLAQQDTWDAATANVFVADGVVVYQGLVRRDADRPAALRAARGLAGVRAVRDDRIRAREWQGLV